MDIKPKSLEKIAKLIEKGVDIPNPMSIDIGDEVDIDNIAGNGVKIYPGCRIYGEKTVISSGVKIGYEAPVTIDNCQLGAYVELKGGYFNRSIFLERSNMGLGAHVREGCILEEEAGGAHCVGLKQTILFPFVILGSLINFCDCFMAGGTSRKDHSEVGSSYIHFNFTPDGDKATASLIGDVPRGVMLNKPRIFLGGQGGIVGPVRIGFGNVIAAGSIIRKDCTEENKMIISKSMPNAVVDIRPGAYPSFKRILKNNIFYIANLLALEEWYVHVRQGFFKNIEFGNLLYEGLLDKLTLAKKERIKRLKELAEKTKKTRPEFYDNFDKLERVFTNYRETTEGIMERDTFLEAIETQRIESDKPYIEFIKGLPETVSLVGTRWLDTIAERTCKRSANVLPNLKIF
ncbi:MAG: hypothetical protein N3D15_07120 [Syntrophorhabdaceae bacterium]|nr:hypothetical protein [Syntrophorhabdaceae bacterium]